MRRGLAAWLLLCLGVALLGMAPQPAPLAQQCANSYISTPRAGATIRGDVEIGGSANIDRFQFYKVEFSSINSPDAWAAVSATIRQSVVNGRLDVWNTRVVPDGLYILKLTVVDERGQEVCRSVVPQLQVVNTIRVVPTNTPAPTEIPNPTDTPVPSPTSRQQSPTQQATANQQQSPTPRATGSTPTPTIPPLPTIPPPPPGPTPASVAQAAAPSPTAGTRVAATPAATPSRSPLSSLIPDLSGVRSAFDLSRVRDAFLLGAIATVAAFTFVGLVLLLRRLL